MQTQLFGGFCYTGKAGQEPGGYFGVRNFACHLPFQAVDEKARSDADEGVPK